MEGLVSTAWLAEQLAREELRVLDLRNSFAVYEEQHLPRAQFVHIETLRMTEGGTPCKMHTLPVLEAIFGQLGIRNDTPVVIYTNDPSDQLSASYAYWSLAVTGHAEMAILDGGLARWEAEGRPVTQAYPHVARETYAAQFDPSVFADWSYVRDHYQDPDVVLVDSRTRSMYEGTSGPTMRLGHIPGAVLYNYLWNFHADGLMLPRERLRDRFRRRGVVPEKEVITYCVTGREGSSVWFVLKYILGFPRVRLYQASLTEWAAHPELPMVTGNEPWGEERKAA